MRTRPIGEQGPNPTGGDADVRTIVHGSRHDRATRGARDRTGRGRETHDWARLAATPEFQRLHHSRRRFTLTGMAIQTSALILVMGLYGFAPDAMGEPAIGSITWALLLGHRAHPADLRAGVGVRAQGRASGRRWPPRRSSTPSERVEPTGRFAR